MRQTFGQVKSTIATVLNLNASDARVLGYVNRACERLLYEGKWRDTVVTYAICVNNGCLTWPREIDTIEAVVACDLPLIIRNEWFDFLDSGPGPAVENSTAPAATLIDRGQAIAFDDITTTGYKLAVWCDGNEAAGAQILIRYYDSNGNKVYSTVGGTLEEGEFLTLPPAGNYVYSSKEVLPNGWYFVKKPQTLRQVRVYAYKIAGGTTFPLAYYEPDEEVPVYRRSLIVGLSNQGTTTGGSCSSKSVIVRAKLRFIPAFNDNSVLPIPHVDAIRLAAQAIRKEENNMIADAAAYWQMANNCLDKQLHHTQGDGVVVPIKMVGGEVWGGGVVNYI